jgi:hypothetical protein
MLARNDGESLRAKLLTGLGDIGWGINESGLLITQDALVSERFFSANSEYDAYVAIRDVLTSATSQLVIVDAYVSSSLLQILGAAGSRALTVRIMTVKKNLPPDFAIELATFRKQFPNTAVELRSASDFHDRFIVVDNGKVFHIGASIKDAGRRAFMVSRVEDSVVAEAIKTSFERTWSNAIVI